MAQPTSLFPAKDIPLWQVGEDDTLRCVAVRDETHDVKTFVFEAAEPRRFHYLPGQFITLELLINGETINRCYTLSSTPTRPDRVSITVKRIGNGPVSGWLHDNLKPGMSVTVLGPSGEFTCASHPAAPYLFLSAGSGITPLMSMSRALTDLSAGADIAFVHSARSPKDIIFKDELALLARQHAGFRQLVLCETREGDGSWPAPTGRLSRAWLEQAVPDWLKRTVFCCGPAPYMAAVKALLQDSGFDMQRYHEESFNFAELSGGAEPQAAEPVASDADGAACFSVKFAKLGNEVKVASGQTVLGAALSSGMRLPASCTKGLCGTCKTKLLEGKVDMQHGGGIRQREIDQGFFLPCCSTPLTDLVVDR